MKYVSYDQRYKYSNAVDIYMENQKQSTLTLVEMDHQFVQFLIYSSY
jgi:hypothetical protein